MLFHRVELALVGVALSPLWVGERGRGKVRHDQLTLACVAFRETLAATGACCTAQQKRRQCLHDFNGNLPERLPRRKKNACRFSGVFVGGSACVGLSHRQVRGQPPQRVRKMDIIVWPLEQKAFGLREPAKMDPARQTGRKFAAKGPSGFRDIAVIGMH